ncbi:MAG TPA: hypothetical protein VNS79_12575 [Sphingobium sp.]|nr:hypothetical protein [Sphingobium sp.]
MSTIHDGSDMHDRVIGPRRPFHEVIIAKKGIRTPSGSMIHHHQVQGCRRGPEAFIQWTDALLDTDGDIAKSSRAFLQGWMDRFADWVRTHAA